jgi:hypothetical protein
MVSATWVILLISRKIFRKAKERERALGRAKSAGKNNGFWRIKQCRLAAIKLLSERLSALAPVSLR